MRLIISLILILSNFVLYCKKPSQEPLHFPDFKEQNLLVNPDTSCTKIFSKILQENERTSLQKEFEKILVNSDIVKVGYNKFLPILFEYRDPRIAPLFRTIIADSSRPIYLRLLAVYSLSQIKNKNDFSLLLNFKRHPNDLFREYIIAALGKLADSSNRVELRNILDSESNPFVAMTIKASIQNVDDLHQSKLSQMVTIDTFGFDKELSTYDSLYKRDEFFIEKLDTIRSVIPVADRCVFPHQQYEMDEKLCRTINYAYISYGIENRDWGMHVGEDSGWLFPGMPVHSIMNGIVVRIQRESSWGCLVTIQSQLPSKQLVTVYYGHLSHDIDVSIGQTVVAGEMIGVIAISNSTDNGGYLAHLHLGIEKGYYRDAVVKGWYTSDDNWYSPLPFIVNFKKNYPHMQCGANLRLRKW